MLFLALAISPAGFAQNFPWPKPDTTSLLERACLICSGSEKNLPTYPFSPSTTAVDRHVGRFLDSTQVRDFQGGSGLRTLRAKYTHFTSDRVYMILGEGLASYARSNYFATRLGSPMVMVSAGRAEHYEQYLQWDDYEYAEDDRSGWIVPGSDGQKRLFAIDIDDRGYVYLAYHQFSWGIVSDSSGLNLVRQVQEHPGLLLPTVIGTARASGKYYALVSDPAYGTVTLIYDVTDPEFPELIQSIPMASMFISRVSSGGDDTVALNAVDGKVRLYSMKVLANGGAPAATLSAADGKYFGLTTDGTKFYTATRESISMDVTAISTAGVQTRYLTGALFRPYGIRYGGGHLSVVGLGPEGYPDLKMFRVASGSMEPVNLGNFFVNYYTKTASPDGNKYAKPSGYIAVNDAVTHLYNGKTYLFYSVNGLGDVFEINSNGNPCSAPTGSMSIQYSGAVSLCTTSSGSCKRGESLNFEATTTLPLSNCDTVEWDFGDGSAGSGKSVTHAFGGSASSYSVTATVKNSLGAITARAVVVPIAGAQLGRGDSNGDGSLTVADVFYSVNNLFAAGPGPVGNGDANSDGSVTVADVFFLVNYLFASGSAPLEP